MVTLSHRSCDMESHFNKYWVFLVISWDQGAKKDMDHYNVAQANTEELYKALADNPKEAEADKLSKFEVSIIAAEVLEHYYKQDIKASVSVIIDPR